MIQTGVIVGFLPCQFRTFAHVMFIRFAIFAEDTSLFVGIVGIPPPLLKVCTLQVLNQFEAEGFSIFECGVVVFTAIVTFFDRKIIDYRFVDDRGILSFEVCLPVRPDSSSELIQFALVSWTINRQCSRQIEGSDAWAGLFIYGLIRKIRK